MTHPSLNPNHDPLEAADITAPDSWEQLQHSLPRQVRAPRPQRARAAPRSPRSTSHAHRPPAASLSAVFAQGRSPSPQRTGLPLLERGSAAERRRRPRPIRRANVLSDADCATIELHIAQSPEPRESKLLQFRLLTKAGLRVGEVSQLPLSAMVDGGRRIKPYIDVYASKTDTRRLVPMHPLIRDALAALIARYPEARWTAFSLGRGGRLRPQSRTAVTNYFHRLFREVGFEGYSSHSGRRTFATKLMRHASIMVVKDLLGHAKLSSTQLYIEPGDDIARLVHAL